MFNANAQNWFGMGQAVSAVPHTASSTVAQLLGNNNNNGNATSQAFMRQRSLTNSNPSLERSPFSLRPQSPPNVQVEYEVAVPFMSGYRHTPYHSLWDLHQW